MTQYFELKTIRIHEPEEGELRIATAAILSCSLCGQTIDGMGGPGDGAICYRCGTELRKGTLKGCVKWDQEIGIQEATKSFYEKFKATGAAIGFGVNSIFVYVPESKSKWHIECPAVWEGYPVEWHWETGKVKAGPAK